jgi:hypothetical protein
VAFKGKQDSSAPVEKDSSAPKHYGTVEKKMSNRHRIFKKYGCCFYKVKLHTNGFCLFCFLGIARRMFYPALFTLLSS